ncbi:MAG: copper resistance CopC family protein [Thermoleophilia bacterium]
MTPRILVATIAAATALGIGGAATAGAHTGAIGTSPKHGSTVRVLPKAVAVTFGGPLARAGTARITRNGRGNFAGRATLSRRSAAKLIIPVKRPGSRALHRGRYRVVWRAVSPDGHTQRGVFAFRVR